MLTNQILRMFNLKKNTLKKYILNFNQVINSPIRLSKSYQINLYLI
jgi:hypothetical protein